MLAGLLPELPAHLWQPAACHRLRLKLRLRLGLPRAGAVVRPCLQQGKAFHPERAVCRALLPDTLQHSPCPEAGFFYGCIWPSLASARECAWTKVFQNDNIVKNFEKVHWEGACKE